MIVKATTLEGGYQDVDLSEAMTRVVSYPDDGVVYLNSEPCKLDTVEQLGFSELLAACQKARAWMGERPSEADQRWPHGKSVAEVIDALDAAIVAATADTAVGGGAWVTANGAIDPISYQGSEVVPYNTYLTQYNDLVASRKLYRQRASELAAERNKLLAEREELLALLSSLHDALEFARTRKRPSWAYEWLFGKKSNPHKHAVILKLDEIVEHGVTAVPDEPDPPYPHRTRVCANCGTAVDEEDLADGNLCHICIKR